MGVASVKAYTEHQQAANSMAAALQAKTTKINGNFDCNTYLDIAVFTSVYTVAPELLAAISRYVLQSKFPLILVVFAWRAAATTRCV